MRDKKYAPTNVFALALRIYFKSKLIKKVKILNDKVLEERISFFYSSFESFDTIKQEFIIEMSYILLRYIK